MRMKFFDLQGYIDRLFEQLFDEGWVAAWPLDDL